MASVNPLNQRRILVVEDEYLVATYLSRGLAQNGATVIGPVARVNEALALIDSSATVQGAEIDAAILDVTLNDVPAFPVADRLLEADVPFVFATGYDRAALPERYSRVALCVKPVQVADVIQALCRAMTAP